MTRKIKKNKLYHHFKGHVYKVLEFAKDSRDLSLVVVYQNVNTKEIWVRNYDEFNSLVDTNKYPDVMQKYRFMEID